VSERAQAAITRWCSEDNPGANYSSAVRCGDLIFVAGQIGVAVFGDPVPFEEQLRRAIANLLRAVGELGGDRTTLLKVNGYLADLDDFERYNAVYAEMLGDAPRPARTTVAVGRFAAPILVELDATAAALPGR